MQRHAHRHHLVLGPAVHQHVPGHPGQPHGAVAHPQEQGRFVHLRYLHPSPGGFGHALLSHPSSGAGQHRLPHHQQHLVRPALLLRHQRLLAAVPILHLPGPVRGRGPPHHLHRAQGPPAQSSPGHGGLADHSGLRRR